MSKKDYEYFAQVLADARAMILATVRETKQSAVAVMNAPLLDFMESSMIDYFKADNPRFDERRFRLAAIPDEPS